VALIPDIVRLKHRVRFLPGNVVEVFLNADVSTLIDVADLHLVARYQWYPVRRGGGTYVEGSRKSKKISLHRVIMDAPRNMYVDHKNCDPLDNRRCNLRLATPTQNLANQRVRKDNTLGFRGVEFHKQSGKYRARIKSNGRLRQLGLYSTAEEAARAYDVAAVEVFGEFANPNFPVVVQ